MKAESPETSPMKAVVEELETLQIVFRETVESYVTRIETEIAQVKQAVQNVDQEKKIPSAKIRDLRDMLTLLRNAEVKAGKGRRKDLKKIDGIIGDLTMLVEHW